MTGFEFLIQMKDHASSGIRKLKESIGMADRKADQLNGGLGNLDRKGQRLQKTFGGLKRVMAGAFAVASLTMFTGQVVGARSEYEKFQAVLNNTFQNADVGQGALNLLSDFAKETPFQLNELTGSFVKLVNRGFEPTKQELTALGDLASSQGKGFDQLTEAILDAETNEFERLKEFGIKAKVAGEKVTLTFKDQKRVIDANSSSIRDTILQFGTLNGVANSMDAISKTLGGRISNLKDQWWQFLVAVGGQSGGIFSGFIEIASRGLELLTSYLPYISAYFSELFDAIKPVWNSVIGFIKSMLGITDVSSAMRGFANIMYGVLQVVDWMSIGLNALFEFLSPFATEIGFVTGAWMLFNAVVAMSPVGWIITAIIGISTAIGFLSKHVDFTGVTWKKVWEGAKMTFKLWVATIKFQFTTMVDGLMMGIDKIRLGWYKFKESVGMGDSAKNQQMISDINASVEARKQAIKSGAENLKELAGKTFRLSNFGVEVDTDGVKKDFQGIKDKFSGLGVKKSTGADAYLSRIGKGKQGQAALSGGGTQKAQSGTIVSGGAKKTNINITIGKLNENINIHVAKADESLTNIEKKVQEVLLRAVNSVNHAY